MRQFRREFRLDIRRARRNMVQHEHRAAVRMIYALAILANLPLAALPPEPIAYETVEQAVEAAFEAVPESQYEWGGAILECGDGYMYTAPVTTREPTRVSYRIGLPTGCQLAAIWHTHPPHARLAGNQMRFAGDRDRDRSQPTQQDIEQAVTLGVLSYIHTGAKTVVAGHGDR